MKVKESKKVFSSLYQYLNTSDINTSYLQRTAFSLSRFLSKWGESEPLRESYRESNPFMYVKTLELPVENVKYRNRNHIPKYMVELMYKIATKLDCILVWSSYLNPNHSIEPQHTVKIVGDWENVELCEHVMQRVIIDLIKAEKYLVELNKSKNKHLFGKQRKATAKAKKALMNLVKSYNKVLLVYESSEFTYHRTILEQNEKIFRDNYKVKGYVKPTVGFKNLHIIKH